MENLDSKEVKIHSVIHNETYTPANQERSLLCRLKVWQSSPMRLKQTILYNFTAPMEVTKTKDPIYHCIRVMLQYQLLHPKGVKWLDPFPGTHVLWTAKNSSFHLKDGHQS